jgi:hypothetical protein
VPIDAHNRAFLEAESRALRRTNAREAWLIERILERESEPGPCCEDAVEAY